MITYIVRVYSKGVATNIIFFIEKQLSSAFDQE